MAQKPRATRAATQQPLLSGVPLLTCTPEGSASGGTTGWRRPSQEAKSRRGRADADLVWYRRWPSSELLVDEKREGRDVLLRIGLKPVLVDALGSLT